MPNYPSNRKVLGFFLKQDVQEGLILKQAQVASKMDFECWSGDLRYSKFPNDVNHQKRQKKF
jgi:hypothetical protein